MKSIYKTLSEERKQGQDEGTIPMWMATGGYQLFKEKYKHQDTVRKQYELIARTAAKHVPYPEAYGKFFNLLWNGWLSPSTPVLANMGTNRGFPVSCSGNLVGDSVNGFYSSNLETALLTKGGFGTSSCLDSVRPRGSYISTGGKSSGVLPVIKTHVQTTRDVTQGTSRRGAWAGYISIEHGDFDEVVDYVTAEPDDVNIGWIVKDNFIKKLQNGDTEAVRRYQRSLKLKMITGKGYYFFIDKVNEKRPASYKNNDLFVKASNLCSEITLFADEEHTFSCVLSSMNVAYWDEWKDTDAVYWATVFLDCVASEFIEQAKSIKGLEKVVRFTEKGRALGLGQCGLHTLFQKKDIPFGELEAHLLSTEIAAHIKRQATEASKELARAFGEPEWCKGLGVRNTHLIAIAPTKSTALIMGGVSEGINPDPAMAYTQLTAGGEIERVNPILLDKMVKKGVYTKKNVQEIIKDNGSVQKVTWLTDDEKKVFRTAFEINQESVINMASARALHIDQWQSLNLFFSAEEDPVRISQIHKKAFLDPRILGLYYVYTQAGVSGATECEACQ